MPVHDLICHACDAVERDVYVAMCVYPKCQRCGGERTWMPAKMTADVWGGPRYNAAFDMTFASKSKERAHAKKLGLEQCGDRVGGARNEYHRVGDRVTIDMKR